VANLIVRASSPVTLPWAILRAWRAAHHLGRGKPRWIPGGGADSRAVAGHLIAALELERQIPAPPDTIVVPLGTGGTAAGIALGVAWLGWSTRVVAVRVAPRVVANRWRVVRLARKTAALLRQSGLAFDVPASAIDVNVRNGMGKGYGYPTDIGERARALAADNSVRLDPTYGAKAFGALIERGSLNMQRVVFWHTFAWP
jgi:D-cysteine desulfhydrase